MSCFMRMRVVPSVATATHKKLMTRGWVEWDPEHGNRVEFQPAVDSFNTKTCMADYLKAAKWRSL